MIEFPIYRHVKRGEIVTVRAAQGYVRRPALTDGLHVEDRDEVTWIPAAKLAGAGYVRFRGFVSHCYECGRMRADCSCRRFGDVRKPAKSKPVKRSRRR